MNEYTSSPKPSPVPAMRPPSPPAATPLHRPLPSPLSFTHPLHFSSSSFSSSAARPSSSSSTTSNYSSSSISFSPSSDPKQYHLRSTLNPFKYSKDETSGLFAYMNDEERFSMYTADDQSLARLRRQLELTYKRKPKPPPPDLLSSLDPPPQSAAERSRMNLLRWLASPMCALFTECDDSVSVNDLELDELVEVAGSTEDAGVNVIRWLVKWSAEGRKYAQWQDVVRDMRAVTRGNALRSQQDLAIQNRMREEERKREALQRTLQRERDERFATLKLRQEEEKRLRATRRKEREELRERLERRQARKAAQQAKESQLPRPVSASGRAARGEETTSTKSGAAKDGDSRRSSRPQSAVSKVKEAVEEMKVQEPPVSEGAVSRTSTSRPTTSAGPSRPQSSQSSRAPITPRSGERRQQHDHGE